MEYESMSRELKATLYLIQEQNAHLMGLLFVLIKKGLVTSAEVEAASDQAKEDPRRALITFENFQKVLSRMR
jgi:hypothetical protein